MNYLPSHVQIETVNRYCDARCPMCTIKFVPDWSPDTEDNESFKGVSRKAEVMTLDTFKAIASKFFKDVNLGKHTRC
jgi:tRNA G26 N,N-dimethylase Trm1